MGNNKRVNLSSTDKVEIYNALSEGQSKMSLGREWGVSARTIGRIAGEVCGALYSGGVQDLEEAVELNTSPDCYTCIPHHSITLVVAGENRTVDFTHPAFTDIVTKAAEGNLEEAFDLADTAKAINKYMQGRVVIEGQEVLYKGEVVTGSLASRIIHQMQIGDEGFKDLVAFMNKLEENPSYKTRMELFDFISHTDIEITPEGDLICWKAVKSNYKDYHTGSIDNFVGNTVSMPRSEVNDNSNDTCSSGLHCCAKGYFSSFYGYSGIILKVLVNPKDVVSIPTDYNNMKMRTCEYHIVEEVDLDNS